MCTESGAWFGLVGGCGRGGSAWWWRGGVEDGVYDCGELGLVDFTCKYSVSSYRFNFLILFHMVDRNMKHWNSRGNHIPITNLPTASLYSLHLSPTSFLSATYNGSRSILGGIFSVLLLIVFVAVLLGGGTILKLFGGKIGVLELTLGRLKAAGSMSGILV